MQSRKNWLASNASSAILRSHIWFSSSIRSSHLWTAAVEGPDAKLLDMFFYTYWQVRWYEESKTPGISILSWYSRKPSTSVFSAAVGCNGCTQWAAFSVQLKMNLPLDKGSQIIVSGHRQHRAINTQDLRWNAWACSDFCSLNSGAEESPCTVHWKAKTGEAVKRTDTGSVIKRNIEPE